jgi:hypothetical protein
MQDLKYELKKQIIEELKLEGINLKTYRTMLL